MAVASWLLFGLVGLLVEGMLLMMPTSAYNGRGFSQAVLLMAGASVALVGQAFAVCTLLWMVRVRGPVVLSASGAILGFSAPLVLFVLLFPVKAIADWLHFGADWVEGFGWILLSGFPVLLGVGLLGGAVAGFQRWRAQQQGREQLTTSVPAAVK